MTAESPVRGRRRGSEAVGPAVAPAEFMRQMQRFVKAGAWRDAVAYYDQHGASVDCLSHAQLLRLEEIMHVADTVVEFAPE